MSHYDIAIVGGGIGGLMAAYRLHTHNESLRIIILEKGAALEKRHCPIVDGKSDHCLMCKPCGIMDGMAGAGAFSDGKYVISTEYGGWLCDILPQQVVMKYIEFADSILIDHGATTERYMPDENLKLDCLRYDLHMQLAQLKHLGTDANFSTMQRLIASLSGVEIRTHTKVTDVKIEDHEIVYETRDGSGTLTADHIIMSPGRSGSTFLSDWCKKNGIRLLNNQVDIGVRVELPATVWDHFSKKIYEPKIWSRSKKYGDVTRMFCFNERGSVVTENTDGILTVNGHSYKDPARKTQNSNFALLSTTRFTEPFKEPIQYAKYVASLANLISGGGVLVQRLGDLEAGRRTNQNRLTQSTVRPTLMAVAGDLSLCMPKRQLDNIIETLHALNDVAPGTANFDTLLYGIECKYYSARPECNDFELSGCSGIFAVGDGSGFTRSLSHAAANGLYVADKILGLTI